MKTTFQFLPLLAFLLAIAVSSFGQEAGKGAIIIVSVEGDVKVKKVNADVFLPQADIAAGKSIYDGHTVLTGEASKAVLLLSNGSITSIGPGSELTYVEFTQIPFEANDSKISELDAEPSNSTAKLKLSYGDLNFNVKKLNDGSAFEISSPIGVAGIRGTTGRLNVGVDPNTGNITGGCQMTSGAVNFTDPSGNTINLPAGQSTSVTTTPTGEQIGQTQQGEVPPEDTQQIQEATQEAEEQSADITVGEVTNAVQEVGQQVQESQQPSDPEPEDTEPGNTEPDPAQESTESSAATSQAAQVDSDEVVQLNMETDETVEIIQESGEVVDPDSELIAAANALGLPVEARNRLFSYSESVQESILGQTDLMARYILEMDTTEQGVIDFLAFTPETQTDIILTIQPPQASTLVVHGVAESQIQSALSYSESTRDSLFSEPAERLVPVISYDLDDTQAAQFFTYSETLRQALVDAKDEAMVKSLLDLAQTEEVTATLLTGLTANQDDISQVDTSGKAPADSTDVTSAEIASLVEVARNNGNDSIIDILYDAGNGKIDSQLLAAGQLGNDLLTDVTVEGQLASSRFFSTSSALDNLFYQEVSLLFQAGLLDTFLTSQSTFFASRNLTLNPGNLALDSHYSASTPNLFLTAAQDISLAGDLQLSAPSLAANDLTLNLATGGKFNFAQGSSLTFSDGAINLASGTTSEYVQVSMEAGGDIAVRSLENLVFQDSSLHVRAGDNIHLQALQHLSIDGLQFSDQLKTLYMQAITIDLRNIYFPDGSTVHLQSQFGGIQGIYPNFGSSEVGRVNFIENVGYHQTLIDNQSTFDQFRHQILITPLSRP